MVISTGMVSIIHAVEPLYCGHLGDLVSCIERCPHLRGNKAFWEHSEVSLIQSCPYFRVVQGCPLTLSLVETCFHTVHINLYGVFILGVDKKYGLSFVSLGSKVAYTGERVKRGSTILWGKVIAI